MIYILWRCLLKQNKKTANVAWVMRIYLYILKSKALILKQQLSIVILKKYQHYNYKL